MSPTKHSTEFSIKSQMSFKDKVILTLGNPFLYPVRSKNEGLKDELHNYYKLKKIFKSLILLLIQMLPLRLFASRKD